MSKVEEFPFIRYVAKALCEADGLDPEEEWEAYEDLAIEAIRAIKVWFENDIKS